MHIPTFHVSYEGTGGPQVRRRESKAPALSSPHGSVEEAFIVGLVEGTQDTSSALGKPQGRLLCLSAIPRSQLEVSDFLLSAGTPPAQCGNTVSR